VDNKQNGTKRMGLKQARWMVAFLLLALFTMGAKPLKYTEDRTPSTLNPLFAQDMYSVRITELLFEGLIGWDKQQQPTAMLATSWTIGPDKKSITLTLRKGVKWHDNKPFTSADVAFTIKAMTSQRSQIADRYLAQIIRKVKTAGPHSVQILFKKPLNKPLKWLQFKIIPKHRFFRRGRLRLPKMTDYFSQKPYGTGPFRFKRWVGRKIVMRRFSGHWRADKVRLTGATLQAIPDKTIQREVLRFGGLDAIVRARPKDVPMYERDRNVQLLPYSTNDWWYIGVNHKSRILRNRKVREAIAYAMDRDGLREAHLGDGQTISGPFSPNDPLYNFKVEARTQNRSKAKKLLAKAGWRPKGSKGPAYKGGKPLKLRMLIAKSRTSYKPLCLAIQGELLKVGIQLELVWLQDAKWRNKVMTKKKFDLSLHIWNFDDLSTIYPLFYSKGSRNYVGYRNKEVDRLLKLATKTTDPAIYKRIFQKLHRILHKDLPYIFLWSLTSYSALSKRVKRVTIHPFNYFHYAYGWQKK
jgi:peptide/nickel transport system substrate-binding protein